MSSKWEYKKMSVYFLLLYEKSAPDRCIIHYYYGQDKQR